MSFLANLHETCNRVQQIRKDAVEAEKAEEPVEEIMDGLPVKFRLFHSDDRRGETRREMLIDGYDFACEIEYVPWNILKGISMSYWVWLDLPKDLALKVIQQVKEPKDKITLMEEFYPTENGPARWNAHAKDPYDVVALYKVWAPKYKPKT